MVHQGAPHWLNFPASIDDYRFSDVIPCNQSETDPPTHYQDNSSFVYGGIDSQDSLEEVIDTSQEYSNLYTTQQLDDLDICENK